MKVVIGITGSFGSGCTYIAERFIKPKGYAYLSLSNMLREVYKEEIGKECRLTRHEMQEYGNKVRNEKGPDYLAKKAFKKIESSNCDNWIVDSIRNPNEVTYLKSEYSKFYLFAIYAGFDVRWNRVKNKYEENEKIFREDDSKDSNEDIEYGQKVRECYEKADIIISNNDTAYEGNDVYVLLKGKIDKYMNIIENNKQFVPSEREAIMAMAYANSMRSSCLKRKVGAIIVDNYGNIFSSGYNEVPVGHKTCKAKWGKCYRTVLRDKFSEKINAITGDETIRLRVKDEFHNEFKILDYCRALHAEENAILNIARFGSSVALRGAALYTTTFPCNLCANKIVQVGISKVVYLEPYPMEEAKKILFENKVIQEPFEGVSFNGYFRFMEV